MSSALRLGAVNDSNSRNCPSVNADVTGLVGLGIIAHAL